MATSSKTPGPARVTFLDGRGEMPMVEITTAWSTAEIYLHGAHVTNFKKHDEPPILFLSQCSRFEELTGRAGDVVILHPYILHASSQNVLGVPRLITNPPVMLKDPLNFNRPNPDDFSPLERATLHYLGVERIDFKAASPRKVNWWVKEPDPKGQ